ncbi:MAG: DUF420 domain-containing protein [Candidatus Bathyarchaeota archaeon]|nr:DUF420 domain-containing protein [Candidatus Bathyarchaeota archaeon]
MGEIRLAGIFGTGAVLQTDINLILQIVMFLIIVIGLVYKNKRKFKIHGGLMGIAVILHVISFLLVMGPSFSEGYDFFTTATSELGVQTTWIHAVPGAIAMIMGIVLVGAWALRSSNIAACRRRKRLMDITVLLWLISLIFGITTYIVFYV